MTLAESHAGIHELYARYPFEIDANDAEELADCFVPDGVFLISGQGRFEGRDQIEELVRMTAAGRPRHLTFNLWIREVDVDVARAQAYFMLVDTETGENVAYGHYQDRPVRCEDGRWRWAERRVQFEWTADSYAAQDRAKAVPLGEGS